jgi:hypothetical protein
MLHFLITLAGSSELTDKKPWPNLIYALFSEVQHPLGIHRQVSAFVARI